MPADVAVAGAIIGVAAAAAYTLTSVFRSFFQSRAQQQQVPQQSNDEVTREMLAELKRLHGTIGHLEKRLDYLENLTLRQEAQKLEAHANANSIGHGVDSDRGQGAAQTRTPN